MAREKTLRELFPIVCRVCGEVIQPPKRDEVPPEPGEDYMVTGQYATYSGGDKRPIPMNLYTHRRCL
jgi:hypothetical protein